MIYQALFTTVYIGIMLLSSASVAEAITFDDSNAPKTIYVQDRYGSTTSVVRKSGQNYNEYDRYGNLERVYKKSGNTTYIYDRYGNCIGSFKKDVW